MDTFLEHREFLQRVGNDATVQVLGANRVNPDDIVRKALRLGLADEVVRIEKLFFANKHPVIYAVDFIPLMQLGTDPERSASSEAFFDLLEKYRGRRVEFTLSDIVCVSSPREVANGLDLPVGAPILMLQETFLDHSKMVPLAFAYNYYHPDIHFQILRHRS